MAERKEYNHYQYSEGKTGMGQLVQFTCDPEDVIKIKELLSSVRTIELPTTHYVSSSPHGCYGRYSRFQIEQHKYAGGGYPGYGSYIEILEIKNPPDNRHNIVLHEDASLTGAYFSEFTKIEQAKDAFEQTWRSDRNPETLAKLPGFMRTVRCGKLTPWFYAIGEQSLIGDFAFPEGLQQDPVYCFGRQFVITEPDEQGKDITRIKTCMGARVIEITGGYDSFGMRRNPYTQRTVYWDDGTATSLDSINSNTLHPLKGHEFWITEAMREFEKLLAGRKERFVINLTDGSQFIGRIKLDAPKQPQAGGNYYAVVTFRDGHQTEGQLDFQPSPQYPTVQQYISAKMSQIGGEILEMTIKLQKPVKRWLGVFYSKSDKP